jgi:hypothetical protein
MRTHTITDRNGRTLHLTLERASYMPLPHCATPLAIRVFNDDDTDEEKAAGEYRAPYGVLTVNMDPHTGYALQGEHIAFVKEYGENENWVPQLMERLEQEGAARFTGHVLENSCGVRYPLYAFVPERL